MKIEIFISIVIFLSLSCSKESTPVSISYVKGSCNISGKDAARGDIINTGESFKVAEKSFAVISIGSDSSAVLGPLSEIIIDKDNFFLKEGTISFILKDSPKINVKVNNMVFSADEGFFEIQTAPSVLMMLCYSSEIKLEYDGEKISGAPDKLKTGDKLEIIKDKAGVYRITPDEARPLRALETINTGSFNQIPGWAEVILLGDETTLPDRLKLKGIERTLGQIWVIETKNSKKYTGHMTAKNKKIEILTASGAVVSIEQKDIKSVKRY